MSLAVRPFRPADAPGAACRRAVPAGPRSWAAAERYAPPVAPPVAERRGHRRGRKALCLERTTAAPPDLPASPDLPALPDLPAPPGVGPSTAADLADPRPPYEADLAVSRDEPGDVTEDDVDDWPAAYWNRPDLGPVAHHAGHDGRRRGDAGDQPSPELPDSWWRMAATCANFPTGGRLTWSIVEAGIVDG